MKNKRITKKVVDQLQVLGENPKRYLTHFGENILLKDSISGIWLTNKAVGIASGGNFNRNDNGWINVMNREDFNSLEISDLNKALRYAFKYQKKWMLKQKEDKIELKIKKILKKSNASQEQINKLIKLYTNN